MFSAARKNLTFAADNGCKPQQVKKVVQTIVISGAVSTASDASQRPRQFGPTLSASEATVAPTESQSGPGSRFESFIWDWPSGGQASSR